MSLMSVRELNANVSRALAQAEQGDDIILTRNGKAILRITRDGVERPAADRQKALAELIALMKEGVEFGGPATYEQRTGR